MATTRVPEVLTITGGDREDTDYECYEGIGGYFDGTIFEVPDTLGALALHVTRRNEDGSKDTEQRDRYFYRLDPRTHHARLSNADTVAREPKPQ